MGVKSSNRLLKTGVIGSAVIALCCFTPILVIILGVLGLGGLTGYLDYVLLPGLVVFVGITLYAAFRRPSARYDNASPSDPSSLN